jgi:hypothetical protein
MVYQFQAPAGYRTDRVQKVWGQDSFIKARVGQRLSQFKMFVLVIYSVSYELVGGVPFGL